MEEQKENVYFGCLPTPESGICSGTEGEEEEKKELSKIERERWRRAVKDCVRNRVEVAEMYGGDGK